jgi:hypothetical protein
MSELNVRAAFRVLLVHNGMVMDVGSSGGAPVSHNAIVSLKILIYVRMILCR